MTRNSEEVREGTTRRTTGVVGDDIGEEDCEERKKARGQLRERESTR